MSPIAFRVKLNFLTKVYENCGKFSINQTSVSAEKDF